MYRCIKGFALEICDDDGFTIENEHMPIVEGSIWEIPDDENFRLIGGEIRLERFEPNIHQWIEISAETLEEHFVVVEVEEDIEVCNECGYDIEDNGECMCPPY